MHIASIAHKLAPGKRKIFANHGRLEITHVMWNPKRAMQWPDRHYDDVNWVLSDFDNLCNSERMQFVRLSLSCPHCTCSQDVTQCTLWKERSWGRVRCRQCGKASSSARWLCECETRWSACAKHRQLGFACGVNSHKGKKAPLCILPEVKHQRAQTVSSTRRKSARPQACRSRKNMRRLNATPASPSEKSSFEVEAPQRTNGMSWLQCRPLKPGSVAWLVAIRRANVGQRDFDTQAVLAGKPVKASLASPPFFNLSWP